MAGYQTIEALRPILHRGPPPTPVVSRDLVRRPEVLTAAPTNYKPHSKLSPSADQIKQMIALRKRGVTVHAIGLKVGFHEGTVRNYVRHVVVPEHLKIRGRPREEYDVALVERMWREGASYRAIAKAVGVAQSAVYNRLNGKLAGRKPAVARKRRNPAEKRVSPIEVVSRVTGLSAAEITAPSAPWSKAARARVLLQWLMRRKQPDLSFEKIALACGLTDHSTALNAFNRVETVIAALSISTRGAPALIARRIWEAEWPKASA